MFRQTKQFHVQMTQSRKASAGPSTPTPLSAEGTKEQSKGQGDQGQFSCAFTATPLQWHGVGAEQVHLQAWTTLQRTVEMRRVRLVNFNKLMKNIKLLNGSKVLPSVDEVTLCWYTGNSWLTLQDEQFTRGKELSGKMINIVMRKSEACIHNATFTSHKWTEISSWSPGHRSKWDTDKYKCIGSSPRQNNHLLFGRGTKNFTVYPYRWDYRTFNLPFTPHPSPITATERTLWTVGTAWGRERRLHKYFMTSQARRTYYWKLLKVIFSLKAFSFLLQKKAEANILNHLSTQFLRRNPKYEGCSQKGHSVTQQHNFRINPAPLTLVESQRFNPFNFYTKSWYPTIYCKLELLHGTWKLQTAFASVRNQGHFPCAAALISLKRGQQQFFPIPTSILDDKFIITVCDTYTHTFEDSVHQHPVLHQACGIAS